MPNPRSVSIWICSGSGQPGRQGVSGVASLSITRQARTGAVPASTVPLPQGWGAGWGQTPPPCRPGHAEEARERQPGWEGKGDRSYRNSPSLGSLVGSQGVGQKLPGLAGGEPGGQTAQGGDAVAGPGQVALVERAVGVELVGQTGQGAGVERLATALGSQVVKGHDAPDGGDDFVVATGAVLHEHGPAPVIVDATGALDLADELLQGMEDGIDFPGLGGKPDPGAINARPARPRSAALGSVLGAAFSPVHGCSSPIAAAPGSTP